MSAWLSSALSRAEFVDDWLTDSRQSSLATLRKTAWPNRKTEDWKYTPLQVLADASFNLVAAANGSGPDVIEGLNSIDVLFVDGQLHSDISALPAGLSITELQQADKDTQSWVKNSFSSVKPERHFFGLLNDTLATQGVIIDVEAEAQLEQPIRLINRFSEGVETHHRVIVRVAENASVVIIEDYAGSVQGFNTGFAEYELAASARLEHYRFALQTDAALAVGGCHFRLAESCELNSTLVGFGSGLSRLDVDVIHAGEHATANLNAIYLLDGEELFDLHSTIEHAAPNGTTEENVRGIVADRARAVFNGRIHIHRHAQKTLAELNNRNLLLSRNAEINTKPELEIYADDVRCAHGATVAELDKKALYYLQSRGVDKEQAQVMLSFGFINELVDQMPNAVLAEWLRPQLRERFAAMEVK